MGMDSPVTRPLVFAAAAAVAIFALMVGAYYVGPVSTWDGAALDGLSSLAHHARVLRAADAMAHSADPAVVIAALAGLCAIAVSQGRAQRAIAAALLVGGAGLCTMIFKVAAAHPRVHPALGDHQLGSTAFPSGHATAAMSLALAAVMIARGRWRLGAAIAGGVYAVGVAIALVVMRWHYPSDVIAGLLVATAVGMLVLAGLRFAADRGRRRVPKPWFSARSSGVRAVEALVGLLALGAAGVAALRPHQLGSFAVAHTAGTAAAVAIAAAAVGLVSALAAELEAG
jgi:membrane-associated phospholipid phosphatase